ncbi:7-carboxy-7-deazaguanine synthase [Ignicoccus pacificus DSM 13166]|uniref:7-carboxy-7-deazaguanine synthase n=1 Tax=Ignicoccus pacificus DSM 13166 TaxID=940294 RepID=A0A977KBK2_9CREN|nr:7-carboxy-7-deazaguanine synthase [Ignicoccus pacificus DSM 13166]
MIFLIEKFISIQGEGVLIGTPALFIRLAKCNLRCPWCDTKYSWEEGRAVSVSSLVEDVINLDLPLTVLTGGEPLLQQRELKDLIEKSRERDYKGLFQIETNATIEPKELRGLEGVLLTLSPKVTCDYYKASPKLVKKILEDYSDMVLELKLVARKSDLPCVKDFLSKMGDISKPIILQPLYEKEYEKEARELVEAVLEDNDLKKRVRVIPQVHKFLKID